MTPRGRVRTSRSTAAGIEEVFEPLVIRRQLWSRVVGDELRHVAVVALHHLFLGVDLIAVQVQVDGHLRWPRKSASSLHPLVVAEGGGELVVTIAGETAPDSLLSPTVIGVHN